MKIKTLSLLSAGVLFVGGPAALHGQSILHTGGVADWTIQYDVDNHEFHVVFRDKGTTEWNSDDGQVLANNGLPGADPANDYTFDTFTVRLHGFETIFHGGSNYFVSSVEGSSDEPDVGIRTRLGHAFDNFTLSLDPVNSVLPGDVILLNPDSDGFGTWEFRLDTADGIFSSSDWNPQGHSHWHWGFSAAGNYELVFNLFGDLTEGGASPVGVTTVNFEVIPEPATVAALLGLAVLGAVLIVRRRRS